MAGLYSILSQSSNALSVQSLALSTAGNNLANVNNSGYAREIVVPGSNGTSGSASVQEIRDSLLDQQVVREIGLTASLTSQNSTNTQAQAAFNENIGNTSATANSTTPTGSGLGNDLSSFFNSFQALAASPTDVGTRQTLLQNAGVLAQGFNTTDSQLAQVQTDINTQLTSDAGSINNLLAGIASLNTQINRLEFNAPGTAVSQRDQRQADLEQLAGLIGIKSSPVAGSATEINVSVSDASGNPINLVSAGNVTNPVAFTGTQFTAGAAATPIALAGGGVEGLLTASTGTVQTLRNQLNQLAGQLAASVNVAYNPTGTTGNFFQVTPGSEAATIAVNPALTPTNITTGTSGNPGDNTIATAVANLVTQTFSTAGGDQIDGSFAQYYSGMVSSLGATVAHTSSNLEDQTNVQANVTQQRDSVSGVSLDQEMTDMMQYQRAYQASAQVLSTIDTLLNTVITNLGQP